MEGLGYGGGAVAKCCCISLQQKATSITAESQLTAAAGPRHTLTCLLSVSGGMVRGLSRPASRWKKNQKLCVMNNWRHAAGQNYRTHDKQDRCTNKMQFEHLKAANGKYISIPPIHLSMHICSQAPGAVVQVCGLGTQHEEVDAAIRRQVLPGPPVAARLSNNRHAAYVGRSGGPKRGTRRGGTVPEHMVSNQIMGNIHPSTRLRKAGVRPLGRLHP